MSLFFRNPKKVSLCAHTCIHCVSVFSVVMCESLVSHFFLCSLFVRFEKIEETLRARPRSGSLPVARTEKMRKVCFSWFWLLLFRGPALCAQFGRRMISFFCVFVRGRLYFC